MAEYTYLLEGHEPIMDEIYLYNPDRSKYAQAGILIYMYIQHAKQMVKKPGTKHLRLFPFEFYASSQGVWVDYTVYYPLVDPKNQLNRTIIPFLKATAKASDEAIIQTVKDLREWQMAYDPDNPNMDQFALVMDPTSKPNFK